jgi:hypothetical protein
MLRTGHERFVLEYGTGLAVAVGVRCFCCGAVADGAEIDLHKTDERRSSRREKAERFARQVGEYRRRGPLLQGATLAAGISTVMANPVEPKMSDSLPWLDPTNLDDRLLASIIEVMRLNAHASVIVVTRDVNFQNKLEFARVPFVSPEDLGIEEHR